MLNLKLAVRMLIKTPFVTAIAVLSLALGIGANSAIFSLYDQILLRKLPVPAPDELVNLSAPGPKPGSQSCTQAGGCEVVFSYPMFRDLERSQKVLTGLAAHRTFGASIAINNEPTVGGGMMVSGSYFPTLQLQPAHGRLITPNDDLVPGANYVAVLGHRFWRDKFGSDTTVLNKTVVVNGRTFTIIGIAPRGFEGTTLGDNPDIYVPISMRSVLQPTFRGFENRRNYWIYVFGRLQRGVSIEQAATALNGIYTPLINDTEAALQQGMSEQTMQQFRAKKITIEPGALGQTSMQEEARTPLYLLFGVTGVVLLIACANIANLLLARGANRAGEMGVRLALGANRRQLLMLLMTESVMLALLGGAASLVVAQWTLSAIAALLPPDAVQSFHFSIRPSVILFAALLSIGTGLLFGLFPALHSTRSDLISVIRAGAGQLTGGRAAARFRAVLVTVQIALSMALLASAGLFLKSLVNVSRVDLGLDVNSMATFSIAPTRSGIDTLRSAVIFARVEDEMARLAGVTNVAAALVPMLSGDNWGNDVRVQGYPHTPDTDNNSRFNAVSAGYFNTMGIKVLGGRDFELGDVAGGTRVAIVNQAFAEKFKLGGDAVGKFMGLSGRGDSLNIQIVGLVANAKYSEVKDSVPPVFYLPWRQVTYVGDLTYYLRTAVPPEQMLRPITETMKSLEPTVPVEELKTMAQQVRENVFLDRMISILSASFALLATLLAAVGLYGVLAYSVAQRGREIGVRIALGADAPRVRNLVLRQVGILTLVGGSIGVAAALGLGRAARSLLYQLEGHDALVFSLSVLLLALVALAAGYIPARSATRVNPVTALRSD